MRSVSLARPRCGAQYAKFYTEEAIVHRLKLMEHPVVVAALDAIWAAANTDDRDAILDRDEYLVMHKKIALALDPTVRTPHTLSALEHPSLAGRRRGGASRLGGRAAGQGPRRRARPRRRSGTRTRRARWASTASASTGAGSSSVRAPPRLEQAGCLAPCG